MESRVESGESTGIQARFGNPGESQGAQGLVLSFGASECLMFMAMFMMRNVVVL